MKRLLGDLPLTTKLLLASFLTLAGVIMLTSVLVVSDHQQESKVRLLTETAGRVELTAYNAAPALATGDRFAANRVLASLKLTESVLSARLLDNHGSLFAYYMSPRAHGVVPSPQPALDGGQRWNPDFLETYRPVLAEGKIIGVLAVATDLTPFRYELAGFGIKALLIGALALLVAYVVTARMQRIIVAPIGTLSSLMSRVLLEKRYDLRATVAQRDEIGALAAGINNVLERISEREATLNRELADRTQAQRRFDELAHYDPVTKLPNRQFFARQIERVLLGAAQTGSAGALIMMDLSNFKRVNDTLGHDAGDSLLLQLANRLTASLRGGDLLCRLGGDEFALVLEQTSGESQIAAVAEKVLSVVLQPIALGEREVRVGASIGIAVFPVDGKEPQVLLRHAGIAMQRAKEDGDNRYTFFAPEMLDQVQQELNVVDELHRAVEQGELVLHFQPQVRLDDGRVCGLEALLRWQHPKHGLLMPGEFIPLAEENSALIGAVADWTLGAACAQIAAWRSAGLDPVRISVNFSAAQLRDTQVAHRLGELLLRYDVPGKMIELEITENQLMSEPRHTETIEELHKLGAGIALANFGTGYSNLGHLKDLPITTLKIDRGFVHGVTDSARYAAITRAIVDLATDLGFETVAEGVESTRQVEFLRAMGCRAYQGFCFSPAVPASEAARFLTPSNVVELRRALAG
jgi:diguanylate cyclase (GGDEF)-like protein